MNKRWDTHALMDDTFLSRQKMETVEVKDNMIIPALFLLMELVNGYFSDEELTLSAFAKQHIKCATNRLCAISLVYGRVDLFDNLVKTCKLPSKRLPDLKLLVEHSRKVRA